MKKHTYLMLFLLFNMPVKAETNYFYTKFTIGKYYHTHYINAKYNNNFVNSVDFSTNIQKNIFKWGFGFVFFSNRLDYSINFNQRNHSLNLKEFTLLPSPIPNITEFKLVKFKLSATSLELNYLFQNRTIFTPYIGLVFDFVNIKATANKKIKETTKTFLASKIGMQVKILDGISADINLQRNHKFKLIQGKYYFYDMELFSMVYNMKETFLNFGVIVRF